MAVNLDKLHAEAIDLAGKIQFFVEEMQWKKSKTDEDMFWGAICTGISAICKQNEIIIELLRRQSGARPVHLEPLPGEVPGAGPTSAAGAAAPIKEVGKALPVSKAAEEIEEAEEVEEAGPDEEGAA
jgi:hypothetical protein